MIDITAKIETFRQLFESQQVARLHEQKLACESNLLNCKATTKPGKKYTKVNLGHSGRFMVEISTGNIFGIKGYGQIHRGHFYGTLDTIADYNWGGYYPIKIIGNLNPVSFVSVPPLTFAPTA